MTAEAPPPGGVLEVSVVVADEGPLYRDALARALGGRPGLRVAACAEDGREAHDLILELWPDVAVLDVRMPVTSGPELCARLAAEGVRTRVLFLAEDAAGAVVFDALESGAAGFISKRASAAEVRAAVLAVGRGEYVLPGELGALVVDELHARSGRDSRILSSRESEILGLIAQGLSSREIGDSMFLAVATVKSHMQSLYRKLGVSERGAAVAEAMRRGLID